MKFLQKFNSFGLLDESLSFIRNKFIDPEIRDTCFDILRDFNEENDCNLAIQISPVGLKNSGLNVDNFFDTSFLKRKSIDNNNLISIHCFSNMDREKKIFDRLQRSFFKHIISYFTSLGYKNTEDRYYKEGYIFFYREKID